jgi:hypothetical protein
MNASDPSPKTPLWIFLAADVALLAAAAVIAARSAQPMPQSTVFAVVACVIAGAIVGLVPLVMRAEAAKNEALDERQRALEALAATVATSAEQIGIAVAGLHGIAELAQKNLRQADQLPHKLQEKIAEFQAQLAQVADADKEELERELLALRTSESERLDAVSLRIAKSAAEWAKLEAAAAQHLAAAPEALAKLSAGAAGAVTQAQTVAAEALAQAGTAAAGAVAAAAAQAARDLAAAHAAALAGIEAKLSAGAAAAAERLAPELAAKVTAAVTTLDERIARLDAAANRIAAAAPVVTVAEAAEPPPPEPVAADPVAVESAPAVAAGSPIAPPKRPRKSRREDASAEMPAVVPPEPAAPDAAPPAAAASDSVPPAASEEPPPVPVAAISEIAPVAPQTAEPFAPPPPESAPPAAPVAAPLPDAPEAAPAAEPPKPARKRSARPLEPEAAPEPAAGEPAPAEPSLALDLDDSPAPASAETGERTLSSDGATRLVVTAYIGIGNRLFLRGEGPGLTWEKGVPLQFVSIGKWRWETNDATGPVRFKLYKNDDVECAALGEQALDPGHQQEVTASF